MQTVDNLNAVLIHSTLTEEILNLYQQLMLQELQFLINHPSDGWFLSLFLPQQMSLTLWPTSIIFNWFSSAMRVSSNRCTSWRQSLYFRYSNQIHFTRSAHMIPVGFFRRTSRCGNPLLNRAATEHRQQSHTTTRICGFINSRVVARAVYTVVDPHENASTVPDSHSPVRPERTTVWHYTCTNGPDNYVLLLQCCSESGGTA